jgi:hypothetical protein
MAKIFYNRWLKWQTSSRLHPSNEYKAVIRAFKQLMIGQATSISLTYPSFDDTDIMKRHLIRCTKLWRGRGKQYDFVFLQNKVVRSKASCDAFDGKAVGKVLCLFKWDDVYGDLKHHSLALIDKFLPMRLTVNQKNASVGDISHLRHHEMFLLEE